MPPNLPNMNNSKGVSVAKLTADQIKQSLAPVTEPLTRALTTLSNPRSIISAATGGMPIVEQLLDFGVGLKDIVFGKSGDKESVSGKLDDQNDTLDDIKDNQKSLLSSVLKFFAFSSLMKKLDIAREKRRDARTIKEAALARTRSMETMRESMRAKRRSKVKIGKGAPSGEEGGGFWSSLLSGVGAATAGLGVTALGRKIGFFSLINGIVTAITETAGAIARGLTRIIASFGILGKVFSRILGGIAAGIRSFGRPMVFTGIANLAALGVVLAGWSLALKQFKGIDFDQVGKAVLAMGALSAVVSGMALLSKNIFLGVAALGAIGFAIMPFTQSLKMFVDINWDDVMYGAAALAGFAAIAGVLGIGPIPLAIIAGSVAIGALGLALIPFAGAMNLFAKAIPAFATGFERFTEAIGGIVGSVGDTLISILDKFAELSEKDGSGLSSMASGIWDITKALAGFMALQLGSKGLGALGNVVGSVGNWITGFIGGTPMKSPIELLAALASMGEASGTALVQAGFGINEITKGLKTFTDMEINPDNMEGLASILQTLSETEIGKISPNLKDLGVAMMGVGTGLSALNNTNIQGLGPKFRELSQASAATAAAQRQEGGGGSGVVVTDASTKVNYNTQNTPMNVFAGGPVVDHDLANAPM
jgi:hypothetical protein